MIHHVEHGPVDAPVVLLVHGAMDRGASFVHVAKRLRDGFRVISVDRRGYSHSLALGPLPSLSMAVDDLAEVLAGRRAIVVGHSFGGVLTLMFADRHPELTTAVVTYEAPLNWQANWPNTTAGSWAITHPDPGDAAERFMRRMVGDRVWDRLPERTRLDRRADGPAFVAELTMIRESGPPFDPEAITCPVVIGKGTRSPRHLRYASDIMAARIPQSHLVVIPDVGHAAHSAKPEQFTQLVLHAAALTNR